MNKAERIKMVKAMEFIARQINDEGIFMGWLYNGVADGDISYGDLEVEIDDDAAYDDAAYYTDDASLEDLMDTFVRLMAKAYKSGGLYCDGIVGGVKHESV